MILYPYYGFSSPAHSAARPPEPILFHMRLLLIGLLLLSALSASAQTPAYVVEHFTSMQLAISRREVLSPVERDSSHILASPDPVIRALLVYQWDVARGEPPAAPSGGYVAQVFMDEIDADDRMFRLRLDQIVTMYRLSLWGPDHHRLIVLVYRPARTCTASPPYLSQQ